MDELKIIIPGRPATKKNSSRFVRRGGFTKLLPSEAFMAYEQISLLHLRRYKGIMFSMPVHLKCLYWLPNQAHYPDLVGLLQATSDILEKAGILENDRLIADYDGSHIAGLDKFKPRAEIYIRLAQIESADPFVQKKIVEKAQGRLFG